MTGSGKYPMDDTKVRGSDQGISGMKVYSSKGWSGCKVSFLVLRGPGRI